METGNQASSSVVSGGEYATVMQAIEVRLIDSSSVRAFCFSKFHYRMKMAQYHSLRETQFKLISIQAIIFLTILEEKSTIKSLLIWF